MRRIRHAARRLQSPVHVDGRVCITLTLEGGQDQGARVVAESGHAWVSLGLKADGKSTLYIKTSVVEVSALMPAKN